MLCLVLGSKIGTPLTLSHIDFSSDTLLLCLQSTAHKPREAHGMIFTGTLSELKYNISLKFLLNTSI